MKLLMCDFTGNTTTDYNLNDTTATVESCVGFKDENGGVAKIDSGSNSVVVNHGLDTTPDTGNIFLTPVTNPGSLGGWWATAITSTTFTISSTNTATADVIFGWQVSSAP